MKKIYVTVFNKRVLVLLIGIILGASGGYFYYIYFGCTNGCPLKSNPYSTMIFGGIIGYLFFDIISDKLLKKE
jgi:H+/Cl- antiporter ClcA